MLNSVIGEILQIRDDFNNLLDEALDDNENEVVVDFKKAKREFIADLLAKNNLKNIDLGDFLKIIADFDVESASSNLLVVFHSAFEQLIRNRSNSESLHNYEEKWTACFITQFICRWETMIALFELPLLRLRLTLISENQNKA